MSRIGSSSGVRVAATQLSNVYTVLLLVAALAMILSVVLVCITLQHRYGSILPAGEAGEKTDKELKDAETGLKANGAKIAEGQKALDKFLGGAPAPAPAPAETPATPPAPAPETPATPATPAEKPAAEKPAAEKPAAEKPAAEKPAAEKPTTETPAAEKPAAEKPAAGKPAAEKPAAEKPAAEKPAAEKPAEAPATPAAPAEK